MSIATYTYGLPRMLLILAAMLIVILDGHTNGCDFSWAAPSTHFEAVSSDGKVRYKLSLGSVPLDAQESIPLDIIFKTEDSPAVSSLLGKNWTFPFFESGIVQIDDAKFDWILPDGSHNILQRTGIPTQLSSQNGFLAEIDGDRITVSAECGWTFVYEEGRLTEIKTPENRDFTYTYQNRHVTSFEEGARSIAHIEYDSETGLVKNIEWGSKNISFTSTRRPVIGTANNGTSMVSLVSQMTPDVATIDINDSKFAAMDYRPGPNLLPTLSLQGSEGLSKTITWNAQTADVISVDDWLYHVTPPRTATSSATLERTNKDNISESWWQDLASGIEESKDLGGPIVRTEKFVSGILAGKVRRISEMQDGHCNALVAYSYDEAGRIIRVTRNDVETLYSYSGAETTLVSKRNGLFLNKRILDKDNRIIYIETPDNKASLSYQDDGKIKVILLNQGVSVAHH
jgi:hypothetical protein